MLASVDPIIMKEDLRDSYETKLSNHLAEYYGTKLLFDDWFVNLDPSNQEAIRLSMLENHFDAVCF